MGSETSKIATKSITLPSDVLVTLWKFLDLKSFLNYVSTNIVLHNLFKNELRPRLCKDILQPLFDLKPKNTNVTHPYKFWEEHMETVWLYYYSLCHNKNVTFSFENESGLSRYRVHELTNLMIETFPHYTTNTRHKSKEYANPGYESDSYDEETGTWDDKSYRTGPFWLRERKHYINVFPQIKGLRKGLQTITFIKSENVKSHPPNIIYYC